MPGVLPRSLQVGDRVAVIAPSGPLRADRIERGLARLRAWGLDPHVMPHALDRAHAEMFAGSDSDRAADFTQAWCDPAVAAVLCARGGYGASRVIDLVEWDRLQEVGTRWLVGSSDITALHQAVRARLGLATLYGPMVASGIFAGQSPHEPSLAALRSALFDGVELAKVVADGGYVVSGGRGTGELVGGNLTLLAASIGTRDVRPATDAIAFLEDVGEQPYRLDRMLTQLLRSGWFDGVRGVVLGTFYDCGDFEHVLHDRLVGLGVPVAGGFLVGHGPVQLTLPLGVPATLDADRRTVTIGRLRG